MPVGNPAQLSVMPGANPAQLNGKPGGNHAHQSGMPGGNPSQLSGMPGGNPAHLSGMHGGNPAQPSVMPRGTLLHPINMPPGGVIGPPYNFTPPSPYGYGLQFPPMGSGGHCCAGIQPYPRMMGPSTGTPSPAGSEGLPTGQMDMIMMEMQSMRQMMSQLNGRMCYLEGKIVQYQQSVAASNSAWPPRPTSQPSQQAVSSQDVARALTPPQTASDTAANDNEHIRDKEITDLEASEPEPKKRRLNEIKDEAEKTCGVGFLDLPLEMIGEIMSYCDTVHKKEMRCVSKWFFNNISIASPELKSLFETYTIKNIQQIDYYQKYVLIANAIARLPHVKLDLQFISNESNYMVSSYKIKAMLTNYKENIVSLNIPHPEILLQPDLKLKNIQRLDIDFYDVEDGLHKNIFGSMLARYGDKLEHLGITKLKICDNTDFQDRPLSNLKSLKLDVDTNIMQTFLNVVNKENITHLSLIDVDEYCFIKQSNSLIFPHLQYLEISGDKHGLSYPFIQDVSLSIIKRNRNTIKKLTLRSLIFDIYQMQKLEHLELSDIIGNNALSFIKCNRDTITKLILSDVDCTINDIVKSDVSDINIPKLEHLEISNIAGNAALYLIKSNWDTITKLILRKVNFTDNDIKDIDVADMNMPKLRHLELSNIPGIAALNLIKCNRNTITELTLSNDFSSRVINQHIPKLQYLVLNNISSKVLKSLAKKNNLTSLSRSNLEKKRLTGIWKCSLQEPNLLSPASEN